MRKKLFGLALAAFAFGAASASAATITPGDYNGSNGNTTMSVAGDTALVNFNWTRTPTTGFQVFTVSKAFEVFLDAYVPAANTPTAVQTTGWVLKVLSGGLWTNLTTDTNHCTAALGDVSGKCNHIATAAYNGGLDAALPGEQLSVTGGANVFAAGTYLLGTYDSAAPVLASATFRVAAVPLPATGLALIAGLGGLAALGARRRRNAA